MRPSGAKSRPNSPSILALVSRRGRPFPSRGESHTLAVASAAPVTSEAPCAAGPGGDGTRDPLPAPLDGPALEPRHRAGDAPAVRRPARGGEEDGREPLGQLHGGEDPRLGAVGG